MSGGIPSKPKDPKCGCGATLSRTSARIFIEGVWYCSDCAYELENPGAVRVKRKPVSRKIEGETFFPLPAPIKRRQEFDR